MYKIELFLMKALIIYLIALPFVALTSSCERSQSLTLNKKLEVGLEKAVLELPAAKIISRTQMDHFVTWSVVTSASTEEIERVLYTFADVDRLKDLQSIKEFQDTQIILYNGKTKIGFAYGSREDLRNLELDANEFKLVNLVLFLDSQEQPSK